MNCAQVTRTNQLRIAWDIEQNLAQKATGHDSVVAPSLLDQTEVDVEVDFYSSPLNIMSDYFEE
jgi:hypothetical protein